MKRLLLGVLFASALSWALQSASSAQQPTDNPPSSTLTIQAMTVADLRTWDTFVTNGARSGALKLRSAVRDPLLPARIVERFDQFHNGVRIWGADVVRDSERGVPISIFGELSPTLELLTDPGLSEVEARAALLHVAGANGLILGSLDLVIARLDSGDYRLAYTAVVSGDGDVIRAFVDAESGAELLRYTQIQRQQAAVGSGRGVLGDQKKVSVEASAGAYVAVDRLRPPIIRTFDMGNNFQRYLAFEAGLTGVSVSDLARDVDNIWTDVVVVDAQAHAGMAYDYFYKRFGRTGIDGTNGPINILTNTLSQPAAALLSEANQGRYATNAYWLPPPNFGGQGFLWFGNGVPVGVYNSNGISATYQAGALDTVAHELTHAVTTFTSNLIYRNESGALNEGFSDMMGKGVEFFFRPLGSGLGQADYVFSKDTDRARPPSSLHGIRSLANPGLYNQPDHYSRLYRGTQDNGGVHINSGIPNHAFYLAIEGGTNRTSGLTVQGVGAANREQIEQVFYRAFTTLTPQSANFSMARITTIQAARDLYGAGSAAERAVTQAWDAVGVTNTSSNAPIITRMATLSGTVPARPGSNRHVITMTANGRYQAILNWSDSSADLDVVLGPVGCFTNSCMFTRADSATRRPEILCWQVRAGGAYWLWVDNFASSSKSYTVQQTITDTNSTDCSPVPALTTTSEIGSGKHAGSTRNRIVVP